MPGPVIRFASRYGERGEPIPREPTAAERARACPYCGMSPTPGQPEVPWCPDFDRLVEEAASR